MRALLDTDAKLDADAKARFKRRTFHVPNLIQFGAAPEVVWRDSCFKRRTQLCHSEVKMKILT